MQLTQRKIVTIPFYRLVLSIALCCALTPSALVRAAVREPPLKCEFTRGAWCVVKGAAKAEMTKNGSAKFNTWRFFDEYWRREVGVVLEGVNCVGNTADVIELVEVNSNVIWEGRRWREAVVNLRKDNSCSLRLMVPSHDQAFVKKAASSLSGHVAACMKGRVCAENILAPRIFDALVKGTSPP